MTLKTKLENIQTIRDGKQINMHRCSACWTLVSKTDNGFIPSDVPYPHSPSCHNKELIHYIAGSGSHG